MKEDYLWDKSGEDARLEALENALAAFRYQESPPPELPQKVFVIEKAKPRRRFLQFGFGAAAFAAVLIALSIIWLPTGEKAVTSAEQAAEANAPQSFAQTFDQAPEAPDEIIETADRTENLPSVQKASPVKASQKESPANIRRTKRVLRSRPANKPSETLTAEERYAYDQLMLALSITGSKLKIVQDKVRGIDDKNAVLETAK